MSLKLRKKCKVEEVICICGSCGQIHMELSHWFSNLIKDNLFNLSKIRTFKSINLFDKNMIKMSIVQLSKLEAVNGLLFLKIAMGWTLNSILDKYNIFIMSSIKFVLHFSSWSLYVLQRNLTRLSFSAV